MQNSAPLLVLASESTPIEDEHVAALSQIPQPLILFVRVGARHVGARESKGNLMSHSPGSVPLGGRHIYVNLFECTPYKLGPAKTMDQN